MLWQNDDLPLCNQRNWGDAWRKRLKIPEKQPDLPPMIGISPFWLASLLKGPPCSYNRQSFETLAVFLVAPHRFYPIWVFTHRPDICALVGGSPNPSPQKGEKKHAKKHLGYVYKHTSLITILLFLLAPPYYHLESTSGLNANKPITWGKMRPSTFSTV